MGNALVLTLPALDDVAGTTVEQDVSYRTMRCAHCESPIPEGGLFCSNCGADAPGPSASGPSLDDAGVAKLTRLLRQETAGEYEIEREIGRGGMGVVYLATEMQLRRRVAIKVLPPAFTFGEGAIERFRREARTAAALDHPNIIPIYRVSSGGELMWYSMKLLEGKTLEVVLRERERLEFEETIGILDQAAAALDYAHRRGVIHRDVKPGNITLDDQGRVTVTDFGIAKEIQETSITSSGQLLGTPHYMSPEQYLGGTVSGAADQYSLAVVAFQCLGHKRPFEASSAYELLSKHVTEPAPPLAELRPELPPHAYSAIHQALAKKPEDRFYTVSDFVNALAGRTAVALPPRRREARRRVLAWGSAGVVTAAAAVYLVLLAVRPMAYLAPPQSVHPTPDRLAAGRPEPSRDSTIGRAPRAQPTVTTLPRAERQPKEAPIALLIIRLSEGWARIYVDGELRGERPVHREQLPPGTHSLRFERPGFLPLDTTLTLAPGQNLIEIQLRRATP